MNMTSTVNRTNIMKTIPTSTRASITNSTIASSRANHSKSRQPARPKTKFFSPAKPALRVAAALLVKNFNRAILLASAAAAARAPASSAHSAAAAAEIAVAAVIVAIAVDVPIVDAVDADASIVAAVPDTVVAAMVIKAASAAIVAIAARSAVRN